MPGRPKQISRVVLPVKLTSVEPGERWADGEPKLGSSKSDANSLYYCLALVIDSQWPPDYRPFGVMAIPR